MECINENLIKKYAKQVADNSNIELVSVHKMIEYIKKFRKINPKQFVDIYMCSFSETYVWKISKILDAVATGLTRHKVYNILEDLICDQTLDYRQLNCDDFIESGFVNDDLSISKDVFLYVILTSYRSKIFSYEENLKHLSKNDLLRCQTKFELVNNRFVNYSIYHHYLMNADNKKDLPDKINLQLQLKF